jgi:SAM-dependent methyltransferase
VLAELGWEVTAVEASPVAVGLARSRGLRVLRGDARSLPFADEQFDLVMSTDMWEHVEEDDQVAAEAFRVCRPGGRLLLTVPAGKELWSGHDVALGHVRRYERAELVALVEGAGFGVTDTLGWNVLLRPVARAKRRTNTSESEMAQINPVLNLALRTVVRVEAVLPVQTFPRDQPRAARLPPYAVDPRLEQLARAGAQLRFHHVVVPDRARPVPARHQHPGQRPGNDRLGSVVRRVGGETYAA